MLHSFGIELREHIRWVLGEMSFRMCSFRIEHDPNLKSEHNFFHLLGIVIKN